MRVRTLVLLVLAVAALAFGPTALVAQTTTHAYTFTWTHTKALTDSYNVVVDGGPPSGSVISVPASSCTGAAPPYTCTALVTLTLNVSHTVVVQAVNIFGVKEAVPFPASPPPDAPAGVTARY